MLYLAYAPTFSVVVVVVVVVVVCVCVCVCVWGGGGGGGGGGRVSRYSGHQLWINWFVQSRM